MKFRFLFLYLFKCTIVVGQSTQLIGSVIDAVTFKPIEGVLVSIEATNFTQLTSISGKFSFSNNLPLGEQVISLSKLGYKTRRYPIIINQSKQNAIFDMVLEQELPQLDYTIVLSDDELHNDRSGADNISGLLGASQDVFQRAAAFEFSASFFKIRGLDSNQGTVVINGLEMNKRFNGRPQWSNWGGLNDALRHRELNIGITSTQTNFGGLLGTTAITTRASTFKAGGRVTYSHSNRTYSHRIMASYFSGLTADKWAYALSIGRRWGKEGYQYGTVYDANSFFVSVEKQINSSNSLNVTAIYTPNTRGLSAPHTDEVYDLKGIRYNEYWGYQNGVKRNSRLRTINEPIIMLNYNWDISANSTLSANVAYQFGFTSSSRIDYNGTDLIDGIPQGGGANPSPVYYQKLPSFFYRANPNNLDAAFRAQQEFISDGQIDWNAMYDANLFNDRLGNNAIYAVYNDKVLASKRIVNLNYQKQLKPYLKLNTSLNYSHLKSQNYAEVDDLLGAVTYLDVNAFLNHPPAFQSNIKTPNRLVTEGDVFKYNYLLRANVFSTFVQAELNIKQLDLFLGAEFSHTAYQREGLFENGSFPAEKSFGLGDKLHFPAFSIKGGGVFQFNGKHSFGLTAAYIEEAPNLQNTYSNPRENHNIVGQQTDFKLTSEKWTSIVSNYSFRTSLITAKITGHYTKNKDANELSFYFADGIGGDNAVFIQEILQNIKRTYYGIEIGIEAQVLSTLNLKAVASIGQYAYANNPNLYLTTQPNQASLSAGFTNGFKNFGTSFLKNYKLDNGPHQAYSLGFEYRDPDFWWFGATANAFNQTYVGINPLLRTSNFYQDSDGLPFSDYDLELASELLDQERFDPYVVLNLTGGKSWRIGKYTIGVFVSISNVLNETYKTGGFENGRNANYRQLRDDKALDQAVFGSKYWYARGTTYFFNLNISF